jgi:hypothetical protein
MNPGDLVRQIALHDRQTALGADLIDRNPQSLGELSFNHITRHNILARHGGLWD